MPGVRLVPGQPSLLEERIEPRSDLPPLLMRVAERPPERLHYLGSSFGLSQQLFNFWRRLRFVPLYVRQTPVSSLPFVVPPCIC